MLSLVLNFSPALGEVPSEPSMVLVEVIAEPIAIIVDFALV